MLKNRKKTLIFGATIVLIALLACEKEEGQIEKKDNLPDISNYPIVSTNQKDFYNNSSLISEPALGGDFFGQDAQYNGNTPKYVDNNDGTITDMVTGLMWEKGVSYMDWSDAMSNASSASTGGYTDWRVPTIKELYSLVYFSGHQGTGNPASADAPSDAVPFLNTDYFDFSYSTTGRYIDVQFISQTTYNGVALNNTETFFGLNLADGRIKAYPQKGNPSNSNFPCRFVRGNSSYGINNFVNNNDGTITDNATGLMWSEFDSGNENFKSNISEYTKNDGSLNWQEALNFSETIEYAGYSDWRLPDAKELQSIVDYTRCPDATNSAAINPLFEITEIINEANESDYPAFWSSTSFNPGSDAIVVYFGRALGYMDGNYIDVHGAGCQRTDSKTGEPSYFGPQGDVRRVYNYVRLVRDAE